jgi:hypothetical protein
MPFEYCCFVSYPHGQNDRMIPYVKDFVAGLETEISVLSGKTVWIDFNNLKGGSRLDETVGPELCKSACMVLIYTPLYFDAEHLYCARELNAMYELEEQRMKLLGERGKGLIIPIILRDEESFPNALKSSRIFYDFTDIELNNPTHQIRVRYAAQIKEMAAYIYERSKRLEEVAEHLSRDCGDYMLPTSEAAKRFVEEKLGRPIKEVAVPFVTHPRNPTSA